MLSYITYLTNANDNTDKAPKIYKENSSEGFYEECSKMIPQPRLNQKMEDSITKKYIRPH